MPANLPDSGGLSKFNKVLDWVWCLMPIIPAFRRIRQEEDCCKLEANLGYRMRSSPQRNQKTGLCFKRIT